MVNYIGFGKSYDITVSKTQNDPVTTTSDCGCDLGPGSPYIVSSSPSTYSTSIDGIVGNRPPNISLDIPTPPIKCICPCLSPPLIGKNSFYIGFGGSTGASTNEHWLHNVTWNSSLNSLSYSDILNNSNYLNNAIKIGNSVRFTQAGNNQTGNIFYTTPIYFLDSNSNLLNWSCYYVFSMGGGSRADGITFILQSYSNIAGGFGGGLAYDGIPNSVAVGYDSYQNYFDPNNNHIEIDVNGSVSSSLITFTPSFNLCGTTGTDKYIYNWVDYINGVLKIYTSESNTKPSTPYISYSIDLKDYLIVA